MKVTLVEDDLSLLDPLTIKLSAEGFDVATITDGEGALQHLIASRPDCVLLDVVLPGVDGEVILRQLREDSWGRTVPVIILSNLPYLHDPESINRANSYLLKASTSLEDVISEVRAQVT